jgi:hypothetical protein
MGCAMQRILNPFHHRHEFYETDEKLTLSVFDKGADPSQVTIDIQPRSVSLLVPLVSPCSRTLTRYTARLQARRQGAHLAASKGPGRCREKRFHYR